MLVIGNRDVEANAISVHGKGNLGVKPRDRVMAELLDLIGQRHH